jgi:Alw26I/Eco31I/Esp3I family type II restriction m6 adenine DNA methyltransferase
MDKGEFRQRIQGLAAYCTEVIAQGRDHPHFRGGKPEENTKAKIIEPLLDLLDFTSPEYRTLETGIARGWIDYSLKLEDEGHPAILVEAKPIFERDLWNRYRQQIYEYIQDYRLSIVDQDPAKWILLTNGYEIHMLRITDREPHWSFTIEEENADLIFDLLLRINVRDGVVDSRYAEERRATLDRHFLEDLKQWRLILANGFHASDPTLSLQDLELASQTYLNRLMFIRILETYRLRPDSWLARLYRNWKDARWSPMIRPFAQEIAVAFREAEVRFNTELLKENLVDRLRIDDSFIEAVIVADKPIEPRVLEKVPALGPGLWSRTIYNYDFSELGVDVLGTVYERFLAHKFAIKNGRVVIQGADEPTEARKLRRREGIYYTPEWVTRFIVRGCLGELVDSIVTRAIQAVEANDPATARSAIHRLALIRVADIAMGSGSFLLQVYELFYEAYEKYNAAIDAKHRGLVASGNPTALVEIMSYARIADPALLALDSVFGVDLDGQAVELAKLNFWLRILTKNATRYRAMEAVHHALPRLDLHFRQGNSLIAASRLEGFRAVTGSRKADLTQVSRLFDEAKASPSEENISAFMALSSSLSFEVSRELLNPFFGSDVAAKSPLILEFAFPAVFLGPDGTFLEEGGFDAVVGNPPYEVLSWKERGISPEEERREKGYLDVAYATRFQKYNLYRFFMERALDLVRPGGYFGYIVPLTLLADESSYRLRYKVFAETAVAGFFCFPERARVFEGVTQAVCIALLRKNSTNTGLKTEEQWLGTLSDGARIPVAYGLMNASALANAVPVSILLKRIRELDPRFMPIPLIPAEGWNVIDRISQFSRLGDWERDNLIEIKQREINLNEDRELYRANATGNRLVRGEHIAPFDLRLDIGEPEYVDRDAFLRKKGGGKFRSGRDHETDRVGIQEVSNLALTDRLKATLIPREFFVGHTVDYIVVKDARVEIPYLIGILNSDVLDWRFRITSTNNHVTTNEIAALPVPHGTESKEIRGLVRKLSSVSAQLIDLSRRFQTVRSAFAVALNQIPTYPSNLGAYLRSRGISHRTLLADVNRKGVVVELLLSFEPPRGIIRAAFSADANYKSAPKEVEGVIAFASDDQQLLDFLCLGIDRTIATHGDGKWTPERSLTNIYNTVLTEVVLPVFSTIESENSDTIRRIINGLPSIGMAFGEALELRDRLLRDHAKITRAIYQVDELPQFEVGGEGESEEET